MTNPVARNFIYAALYFFLIGAVLGTLLRYQLVDPVPWIKYKFLLHGHSHIMLLGWIFNGLMGLSIIYLEKLSFRIHQKFWEVIFWLVQVSVTGMLIFFPLQGYASFSIVFSTMHILVSFAIFIHLIRISAVFSKGQGFLTWAWIFFLLSSVGPFSLGILISKGFAGSALYHLAIYFYLHFLYNGFIFFFLFWLLLEYLKTEGLPLKNTKTALVLLVISCLTGYALSTLWSFPPQWVYVTGWISAILQMLFLILLLNQWNTWKSLLDRLDRLEKGLFLVAAASMILKFGLQLLSAQSSVAYMAYRTPYYIIAYLHLVFLGLFTATIFLLIYRLGNLMKRRALGQAGFLLILTGFVGSEVLLISVTLGLPHYYLLLFGVSSLLPVGLFFVIPGFRSPEPV